MSYYSLVKIDARIYVDGEGVDCELADFPLPEDLHALQWDGDASSGHIEYTDILKPNLSISSEAEIEAALGVSLTTLTERWTEEKAEIQREHDQTIIDYEATLLN